MQKRVFGIFAYNEEKNIISSIESVKSEYDADIYVLINGCSDNTQPIVEAYAHNHQNVKPIILDIGDKSNAWNFFIHDLNIDSELYYFLDGDCQVVKGSIEKIEVAIKASNQNVPNAIAATPEETTKNRKSTTEEMLQHGGLAGGFYALTKQFVDRLRINSVKLPVGTIGEDGLVGALAYWDLKPPIEWNLKNILVLKDAKFNYEPLSLLNLTDIKLYYRRKARYSCRYFQNKIIIEAFHQEGLKWLKGNFNTLYDKYPKHLKITWRGVNTFFDWLALKEIKNRK